MERCLEHMRGLQKKFMENMNDEKTCVTFRIFVPKKSLLSNPNYTDFLNYLHVAKQKSKPSCRIILFI